MLVVVDERDSGVAWAQNITFRECTDELLIFVNDCVKGAFELAIRRFTDEMRSSLVKQVTSGSTRLSICVAGLKKMPRAKRG